MMQRFRLLCGSPARLAALALLAAGGAAAAEEAQFAVSFAGLRAGILAYDAEVADGRYVVRGAARHSGLVGAFFDAEIDTVAEGRVSDNSYRPRIAKEVTREDGEVTEQILRYDDGVPEVTRRPPKDRPDNAAPPEEQRGTADTTTAAYAVLRDRPEGLACDLDIAVYDGRRRHRIRLDEREATGDGLVCRGRYSRVAGFDAEDMAERRHWPLQMNYTRLGNGTYRVERISFPTSYGTARIVRQ